jgi:exosortase
MVQNIASSTPETPQHPEKNDRVSQESLSHQIHTDWQQISVHNYIKMAIIAVLMYHLFRSDINIIVRRWLTDSSWSHGFLIPLFSLYFINQSKDQILNLKTSPNYFGMILLICCLVFYPVNIVHFQYGYFRPLTLIATIAATVLFLGGFKLIKHTWLPIVFLIFAVPLPSRYYVMITMPMRKLAATVATALLNLISGMEATVSGVVIDVIYKGQKLEPALNVAEACSGMRLLMAFMALGVAMAYLHYRPIWQRLVLLASTIPIAIFCNIVRVTTTGFIYIFLNPKYAQGIYHDLLGFVMLPLAFALYGFLAWFMSSLFVEETQVVEDVIVRRKNN